MEKTTVESRPRISLKLSVHDHVVEFIALSFLIVLILIPIVYYKQLPEQIPLHFNAEGKADGFGGKSGLFILPATGLFMYILLSVLAVFPHIYNYPVTITPENAGMQYKIATRLIRTLKAVILILFTFISWMTVRTAAGIASGLGKLFLPASLLIVSGVIIIYIRQLLKQKRQT